MKKLKNKYYCKDCNKKISISSALYGSYKCGACSHRELYKDPKNHPNFKDGRSLKKYYCDCGKEISIYSALYGKGRCNYCAKKEDSINIIGEKNPFFGKKHTIETKIKIGKVSIGRIFSKISKQKLSKVLKGKNNPMFGKIGAHGKWGKYKGIYMRSSWEVIFSRFLTLSGINWKYEFKTFDLGNCTYTPDFYIPEWDKYIEIKGWWRNDDKEKFKLFKKKYKNIKIEVLMKPELQNFGLI